MITRILITLVLISYALEHPLLTALGCLVYIFKDQFTKEELMTLKQYAHEGRSWLKQLNDYVRSYGISPKAARELLSNTATSLFPALTKEQLQALQNNDRVRDLIARVAIEELEKEKQLEQETNATQKLWFEDPLAEDETLSEDERRFIFFLAPDFNWQEPYTYKSHRQLFKHLKSKVRNPDGTISDEIADELIKALEIQIYCNCTNTYQEYEVTEEMIAYLEDKRYLLITT